MGAFQHRLRVRYSECDAQGVVFNANYVSYFDHTITELWREAFGSYAAMTDAGTDIVVAEVRVRYRAPARFDDELDVCAEITRLGTTAMTTSFRVSKAGEAGAIAEGEVRHVFVDVASHSKRAIPDDIRDGLAPYAAPAAHTAPAGVEAGVRPAE